MTKTIQILVQGVSLALVLLINVSLLMFNGNVTLPSPEYLLEPQNITSALVKTLLVTSWRSGSTLIGELLNSHPGSFYNYEPLTFAGIRRIHETETELVLSTQNVINGIFTCNFSSVFNEYSRYHINFAKVENGELLPRIKNMHHNCTSYCHQPLDDLCRRNKFHISKTVRLGLDVASKFLEDPNVKIIYVARDPRGLVNSRLEREWCLNVSRCIDPALICEDMELDFIVAKKLIQERRNQILILRYEEFALNIWEHTNLLYDFLGLPLSMETKEFLLNHTQSERSFQLLQNLIVAISSYSKK